MGKKGKLMTNQENASEDKGIEINAVTGWVPLNLGELWRYRDLLFFFLWRDMKGRYRQMALGPLWIIVGPVVNMFLFTLVFGKLANLGPDGIPYPMFNFTALIVWGLFSGTAQATASSLLDARFLISKVYFPRLVMPLVGMLSSVINFLISLLILVVLMGYYRWLPGSAIMFLPIYLLLAIICGMALGLWWAAWIVHYRDLQMVLDYLLKAWMYACPVVYASSLIPVHWRGLYYMNPMADVVDGVRWCLLGMTPPPWQMVGLGFLVAVPMLILGAYHFRRTERNIVDIA
jgi:lipopolysaccharide transport system permease protein